MIAVGLMLLAALGPLPNAPLPPQPQFRVGPDDADTVPEIPAPFRGFIIGASPGKLLIRSLHGGSIAVDARGYRLWGYELFQNNRYLGIHFIGYETRGYLLVDRAARSNAIIRTADEPHFSPDGRWIASVGLTDWGESDLEGIAVWEVTKSATVRRFFTDAVRPSSDWRIDRWAGDCVAISAVGSGAEEVEGKDPPDANPREAKRDNYSLWVRPGFSMQSDSPEPACNKLKYP